MAVIPGLYISRKLSRQTLSEYSHNYTGRRKQQQIWILVTLQFIFSIGLVYATAMAQAQMGLLKSRACRYENTIELNGKSPFYKELKNINGIESISLSMSSVLNAWMHELPMQQPDGSVKHYYTIQIPTDTAFLSTMHIRQLAGVSPAKAYQEYSHPVFINESYARILNIDASKIGHNLREFDTFSDSLSILAGIIENSLSIHWKKKIAGQKNLFCTRKQPDQSRYVYTSQTTPRNTS